MVGGGKHQATSVCQVCGMPIERFEQLEVWQAAHALVLKVYKTTQRLPRDQKFGLISQMQRAAVSVPASIGEGFKRRGRAEKITSTTLPKVLWKSFAITSSSVAILVTRSTMNR